MSIPNFRIKGMANQTGNVNTDVSDTQPDTLSPKLETIFNINEFKFPMLGSKAIPCKQWNKSLKEKLKSINVSIFAIYDWPPELVTEFLQISLDQILQFQNIVEGYSIQQQQQDQGLSEVTSWVKVDKDQVFQQKLDLEKNMKGQVSPLSVLIDVYRNIIVNYPGFRYLFDQSMDARQVQDRLYDIYVGMWISRDLVIHMVQTAIPMEFRSLFHNTKTLAQFLQQTENIHLDIQWQSVDGFFNNFTQIYIQGVRQTPIEFNDLVESSTLVVKTAEKLKEMSTKVLCHFMLVKTIEKFIGSLSLVYDDILEDVYFDISSYKLFNSNGLLTPKKARAKIATLTQYCKSNKKLKETNEMQSHDFQNNQRSTLSFEKRIGPISSKKLDAKHLGNLSPPTVEKPRQRMIDGKTDSADEDIINKHKYPFKDALGRSGTYSPKFEQHISASTSRRPSSNTLYISRATDAWSSDKIKNMDIERGNMTDNGGQIYNNPRYREREKGKDWESNRERYINRDRDQSQDQRRDKNRDWYRRRPNSPRDW